MGRMIDEEPWATFLMDKGNVSGECANCHRPVHEHLFTLDDCYGVYRGKCPHCGAINLLDCKGSLRGYTSRRMTLCLPTDCEIKMNKWPDSPHTICGCEGKHTA